MDTSLDVGTDWTTRGFAVGVFPMQSLFLFFGFRKGA